MAGVEARRRAVEAAISRKARTFTPPSTADGRPIPLSEQFGWAAFTWEEMQERLPPEVMTHLQAVRSGKETLLTEACEIIAASVYRWASERGAGHFCRWTRPKDATPPETHQAFLRPGKNGALKPGFSGAQLLGEDTARWDPRSPLFLQQAPTGATLCVPCILPEGKGLRAPLRKSTDELRAILRRDDAHPVATLQTPFFLIDEAYASLRPDLLRLGRALYGDAPLTRQHIERIPPRALALLHELTAELIQLGVPVSGHAATNTPSQFVLTTSPTNADHAGDHDQTIQEALRRIAPLHHLRVLTHPTPFQGYSRQKRTLRWWIQSGSGSNLIASSRGLQRRVRAAAEAAHAQLDGSQIVLSCDADQSITTTLTAFQRELTQRLTSKGDGSDLLASLPRSAPRAARGVRFHATITPGSQEAAGSTSTEAAVLLELTQRMLLPTARVEPFFPAALLQTLEDRHTALAKDLGSRAAFEQLRETFVAAEEEIADERWPLPRAAEILLQGV